MPSKQKCSQCMVAFSMLKLARKLPCCDHSICQPCIREIIDTNQDIIICGLCTAIAKNQGIKIFSLNSFMLVQVGQTGVQEQAASNEEENQLLNDLIPSNQTQPQDNTSNLLCTLHRAPLDIVCISDKERICAHCALFGNHKEHRFKRLDDFEREVGHKKKAFLQITKVKQKMLGNGFQKIGETLKQKIKAKKCELETIIEKQFQIYQLQLKKRKEAALKQIGLLLSDYEQTFRKNSSMLEFEKIKAKLQEWEKICIQNLFKLDSTKSIEDKLYHYYDGPLEIVTQGYLFIEQLNSYSKQALSKVKQQLQDIKITFDQQAPKWFQSCVKVAKKTKVLNTSQIKIDIQDDEGDTNPFLDCTSSAIALNKSNFVNSNTSLQVSINSITTSTQRINTTQSHRTSFRSKAQLKSIGSIQKQRSRIQTNTSPNAKKPILHALSPKISPKMLKRPTSELSFFKSPSKLVKNKQKILNEEQLKSFEFKQPEKIYFQFSKNSLSDFFDLSNCNLSSDRVLQYVHRAKRIQNIRGLKLCNNKLTTAGFQKMTQYMQGVNTINVANNLINETVFDVILKHRGRLDSLKVLNLSQNPINLDKKALTKMEEVKRLNIFITL